ncbi:hypothetical protein T11_8577 [Trichinella zimbabwensis]|uniref:HAT C-terminal dimerisation domain-containing protein n=1 Tax=Trichinella zimbabwensis TaxID=268475 RepID=A0A0V1H0J7_9BILA|nr:hypothetical protein T11_8577 [Trichinella zimbabwensis]
MTVWTPFLENYYDKFLQHRNNAMRLSALIPYPLKNLMVTYLRYIDDQGEVLRKWENVPLEDRPTNVHDSLALCQKDYYPNVSLLLQIFTTLPIASANSERSFSALKYPKTISRLP